MAIRGGGCRGTAWLGGRHARFYKALHWCGQVMWKKTAPYNFKCRKVVQLPGKHSTILLTH